MILIGIDPGLTGAVAAIEGNRVLALANIPVEAKVVGGGNQVEVHSLAKLLIWPRPRLVTIVIERVNAMPPKKGGKQRAPGAQSMFNFGEGFGVLRAVAALSGHAYQFVQPTTWKRRAGLIGKEKAASLTLARQLYPEANLNHGIGHGPKDAAIGRAEALLIARFGYKNTGFEDLI